MIPAKRDLVVFHARTIKAKDADVTHMVMATCVDAARYFDLERADVVLNFQFIKTFRDFLRARDGPRGGEFAVIPLDLLSI